LGGEIMTEELLKIRIISGIVCKDGRRYQELICLDANNNEVRVVIPTYRTCGNDESCEECKSSNLCELQDSYDIDIGRSMIIKRM
jgi:hypothetical protein